MSAHTPGPWSWWDSCSFRRLSARRDGDVLHAVVQQADGQPDIHFPNGGYTGPDARLIAAAPDLLDALQLVRDYVVTMKGRGHEYQVAIDAAIAKATGEQP